MKYSDTILQRYKRYIARVPKEKQLSLPAYAEKHRKLNKLTQKRFNERNPLKNAYSCWKQKLSSRKNVSFEDFLIYFNNTEKDVLGRVKRSTYNKQLYNSLFS